ncbi:polysaccharide deacetylase family protein [Actinomycetospora sp. NBRC 106378]|uniref:polysaccharide deacetylase family protein n=1 Tax=Actinomycetospora sp. NBRC 106378 TaxID=3032208 RepID=UPI0024A2122E|nr:polysaccharide deacetylase family protein [Actinomycetospora sp. NBRC 106378]GLZ50880.1 polysaccharide deacetylase [Actinomycetospora sp. NBRC 106378]
MIDRDFVGHARTVPLDRWPDGSLVAVNIVVNVEEGAEAAWPDGEGNDSWGEYGLPIDPAVRDLGTEGHFEFGSRVGIWRLVRLFERFDVPVTFGVCARALERNPPFAAWLRDSDHDVLGHGYRWAEVTAMTEDEERADLEHAMRVLPELVGRPVRGWYVRSFPSQRTRRLAAAHPDLSYDSDSVNDELPYRTEVDGRPWLVVPYSKVHNDTRYFLPPTYATPRHFAESLIGAAGFLLDEARHGAGARLMTVGLHPRWSGQASRAVAVRDFLAWVTEQPEISLVHREQIARWWTAHVPG